MKIVFAIFRYFPFGGLQKDFFHIAEAVAARGHKTICFTNSWDGDIPDFLEVKYAGIKAVSNHQAMLQFEKAFKEFLVREVPDRSVAFNRISGADYYFAGDNCFASLLKTRHNPFLRFLPRYRIYLRQEYSIFKLNSPTKILYLTEKQKAGFQHFYKTQEERFFYLPPSSDPLCFRTPDSDRIRAEKRSQLHIPEDAIVLIQIASDFQCKGVDRTIEAAASLPESVRKKIRLILIGGGTEKRSAKFRLQAQKLGLGEQTSFPGFQSNIHEFLFAADLMVHPARKEGAGIVLYEALAAGLPVICTEVCGYEHLVRDAQCPVLADPFSQDELNWTLQQLLSTDELKECRDQVLECSKSLPRTPREQIAADILE